MLQKLSIKNHTEPFKGPISITRVQPGIILNNETPDTAFGPLAIIDHAMMNQRLTIKMHEHVNDEILSYVSSGVMHHRDSAGFEAPIARGELMMMNAGESFWHEEKVKEDKVEMLQIFVRPSKTNFPSKIQFHDKPTDNPSWYVMVGPEGSEAPLYVRQQVYILDAHPKAGDTLDIPTYTGLTPFLYVMNGNINVQDLTIGKQEAITDLSNPLPSLTTNSDATLVLFFVNLQASMSMEGTISGLKN